MSEEKHLEAVCILKGKKCFKMKVHAINKIGIIIITWVSSAHISSERERVTKGSF